MGHAHQRIRQDLVFADVHGSEHYVLIIYANVNVRF